MVFVCGILVHYRCELKKNDLIEAKLFYEIFLPGTVSAQVTKKKSFQMISYILVKFILILVEKTLNLTRGK